MNGPLIHGREGTEKARIEVEKPEQKRSDRYGAI
jgi:hypothetical protein